MQTRNIPIGSIVTNDGQVPGLPRNPRFIRNEMYEKLKRSIEDAPEMLSMRSLIVVPHGGQFVTICGNMRLRACMELGYKELPCYVLPEDTPAGKLREYTIKDNIGFGENEWDILANEWDAAELDKWGLELVGWNTTGDEEEKENYSRKIDVPTYEPSERKPDVSELTDTGKRDELVAEIGRTEGLPDEVREFLMQAAQRHVIFKYKKIGDFYAHSSKEVQELMERSALVIIDFDKAIENGFVTMVREIEGLCRKAEEDDRDEEEDDDDDDEE